MEKQHLGRRLNPNKAGRPAMCICMSVKLGFILLLICVIIVHLCKSHLRAQASYEYLQEKKMKPELKMKTFTLKFAVKMLL